jgi:hypothetical protein
MSLVEVMGLFSRRKGEHHENPETLSSNGCEYHYVVVFIQRRCP